MPFSGYACSKIYRTTAFGVGTKSAKSSLKDTCDKCSVPIGNVGIQITDKESFREKVVLPGTSYHQRRRGRSAAKIISLLLEMPGYLLLRPLASLPLR